MSEQNPDRAIGDAPELGDESVDVTPDEAVHAESFDFEAWLSGARAVRRAVKLNPRGDLVAVMEEAAERYGDGDDGALEAYEAAKAEFMAASRWFVVEAASDEATDALRKEGAEAAGFDPEKLGDDDQEEARVAALLHQVAAQVVTPEGVTARSLERLVEVAPRELDKLVAAVTMANRQAATSAKVTTPDFSPRR